MENDEEVTDVAVVGETTRELLTPQVDMGPADALRSREHYQRSMDRWGALIGSGALPAHVDTPAKAVAIAAMGEEFGWGPMRALRSIYIVKGNPQMSAQAMLALVYERFPSARIHVTKNDGEGCTIVAQRHADDPELETSFSIEDARKAGLTTKKGTLYGIYAADMLWARCVSRMCRRKFPDVIQGCYVLGDFGEEPEPAKPRAGEANERAAALLVGEVDS